VRISPTEVSVADLSSVKTTHRVGSKFNKSGWYKSFSSNAHEGIFATIDPKEHATRRRLFAQGFSNTSLLRFSTL
jgi:cytochrome P450